MTWLAAAFFASTNTASAEPGPAYKNPSLTPGGIPSAFVANWGDFYAYSSTYAYQESKYTGFEVFNDGTYTTNYDKHWTGDGGVGIGVGFGSSTKSIGIQVGVNASSFRDFHDSIGVDVSIGRSLVSLPDLQIGISGGIRNAITYGDSGGGDATPYVVGSLAYPIKSDISAWRTVQFNIGYGGGTFQNDKSSRLSFIESGFFASAAIQVADNVGIGIGWEGDSGLLLGLSYVPFKSVPLSVEFALKNLTERSNPSIIPVMNIVWSGSFRTPSFQRNSSANVK